MYSDKQIEELFFKAEKNPALFNYQIEGFSIYSVLRFTIEVFIRNYKASTNLNATAPKSDEKFKKLSFTKRAFNKLKKVVSKKPEEISLADYDNIDKIKSANFLFIATSDLVDKEGYSIELFNELKYYKSKGNPVNFIIPQYSSAPKRSSLYDYFGSLTRENIRILSIQERQVLHEFLTYLSNIFSFDFSDCLNQWSYNICFFLNYSEQVERHILQSKCKYVICRSSYTEPWIGMACSRTDTKLIEVQHGVIKPDHVYFNSISIENKKKLLLPDYIMTLGDEWKQIIINQNFVYNNSNVFVLGSEDFDESPAKDERVKILKVVVALQPKKFETLDISGFILDFLKEHGTNLKNIQITIRLHPMESVENRDMFKSFLSDSISISDHKNSTFKQVMLESDVLISATSMCLYEALSYGKAVISLRKYEDQTISKGINYVNSIQELHNKLNKLCSQKKSEVVSYLAPLNLKVLDKFIN